jgi:hypothetical protein
MREQARREAVNVGTRAALNLTALKARKLSLEQLREIDNRLAGQRHAANEIACNILALPINEPE